MAHNTSNPYEIQPSGKAGKLSQLAQLNESDNQQRQANVMQQNSMMEQLAKLYGIQQQEQVLPEHLRGLQLANESEAAKLGYMPQQQQNETALNTARVGSMEGENKMMLAKLGYMPDEQADARAHSKAETDALTQHTIGEAGLQPLMQQHERAATVRELAPPGAPLEPGVASSILNGRNPGDIYAANDAASQAATQADLENKLAQNPSVILDPKFLDSLHKNFPKPVADLHQTNALNELQKTRPYNQNQTNPWANAADQSQVPLPAY